jgi:hypothetical protein
METNQFTDYELVINVMKPNHQRAGLIWGISGFVSPVGL